FPELNAWERAGADASSAGMVDAGFENQKELTKMQLDNQKEIAEMQNETQKEIAGIQSATSRQNTKDQVYAQNEMLAYQQKESTARVDKQASHFVHIPGLSYSGRSEERVSRNAETELVCRLPPEKETPSTLPISS